MPTKTPAPKRNSTPKNPKTEPSSAQKLDAFGIDAICDAILQAEMMIDIAKRLNIAQSALVNWLAATPERSVRVREARRQTAQLWDDKATALIAEAKNSFELAKAKEIAHHYRWRASKIAPREYGEKIAIGGADDLPPIKGLSDEQLQTKIAELLDKK